MEPHTDESMEDYIAERTRLHARTQRRLKLIKAARVVTGTAAVATLLAAVRQRGQ